MRCPSQARYCNSRPTHPRLIGFTTQQNLQHVQTPLEQVCFYLFNFIVLEGLGGRGEGGEWVFLLGQSISCTQAHRFFFSAPIIDLVRRLHTVAVGNRAGTKTVGGAGGSLLFRRQTEKKQNDIF